MRRALTAAGVIVAGVLAAVLVRGDAPLPPIGPDVDPACIDTMRQGAADLLWVAPVRAQRIRGRELRPVTIGELPVHDGELVRVAGVLHLEFEGEALYPSRRAMEEDAFKGAIDVMRLEVWSAPHRPYVSAPPPPPRPAR